MIASSLAPGHVCVKLYNKPEAKEVSISFDNSCGTMRDMGRSSLCCYKDGKNCTGTVFGISDSDYREICWPGNDELLKALTWLESD